MASSFCGTIYEHCVPKLRQTVVCMLVVVSLSGSVSAAFKLMESDERTETARFCSMFDRFFDCLNTRFAGEGKQKRKPDLYPYTEVLRMQDSKLVNDNALIPLFIFLL